MSSPNRLEMFLALNVEAFKRGLDATDAGVRHMAGGVGAAMTATKAKFQEGLGAVKNYNAGLREQHGVTQLLTGSVTGLLAPLAGLFSIMAGAQKMVGVTREFDKLSAGLITATGSAEGAKEAFAAIQDFASDTPYDLAQVTDSFVKLVNFGLNPSERAMTSYGNTASALSKDLNQMIEAVADAATGEFERLKEFGIKSKSEGDKVSFTFRGITETVGKNAGEIEEYLIKLGETNFGDAMSNRMSTLDGALSNMGDEWDKLFLNVSQQGIGNAIADGVRVGIDALAELNAMIVSGELEGYLQAYAGKWSVWAEDVKKSITSVKEFFSGEMVGVENRGSDTVSFLTDAFRNFPENVRAFIGILVVEMASGFDRLKADAKAFKDSIKAVFTSSTLDNVEAERLRQLEIIRMARGESIDAILKERDTAINSANVQIEAAKKLRGEFEKNRAAEKADTTDRTAKFQVKDASKEESTDRKQGKDFSDKSTSKFIEKDGEWVEVPGDEQKTPAADDEKASKEKAEYQKQLAEKRKQLTPEEFKERQDYWKSLEEERPLTKDETKEKKAEEIKFRKEEAERRRLEKEEKAAAKKGAEEEAKAERERLKLLKKEEIEARKEIADQDRLAKKAAAEEQKEEKQGKEKDEDEADLVASSIVSSGTDEQWQKSLDDAKKYEETMQQAHEAVAESGKESAEKWAMAQEKAAEKSKSAFQRYADKVRSLQDEISGRERSLAEELDGLGPKGTEESRWRRQAKEAKEYEKAAKEAMTAGDLDKALSLSDRAKAAYKGLAGGAGDISDKLGDQSAFRGVKSAGLLGIDIAKAIQQATAKTALTSMPGGDMFGDLSGRIRGQLAAVAGGNQGQAADKGAAPVEKIHELKFAGGSMRGGEADVEALLNLLAQAGMSAG